jgi:ubiquinone/menaquinone biosynthesis C-methylase UbiE
MAKVSGPGGKVFAVDLQQGMLELRRNLVRREFKNVVSVLGSTDSHKLPPASVDTMLMVDVCHAFDQPIKMLAVMLAVMFKGLKKGAGSCWWSSGRKTPRSTARGCPK